MCEDMSTLLRSSWMKSSRMSSSSSRATGSRPLVGSSSISRRLPWLSAAAMESFIFMPREYSFIFCRSGRENFSPRESNLSPSKFL